MTWAIVGWVLYGCLAATTLSMMAVAIGAYRWGVPPSVRRRAIVVWATIAALSVMLILFTAMDINRLHIAWSGPLVVFLAFSCVIRDRKRSLSHKEALDDFVYDLRRAGYPKPISANDLSSGEVFRGTGRHSEIDHGEMVEYDPSECPVCGPKKGHTYASWRRRGARADSYYCFATSRENRPDRPPGRSGKRERMSFMQDPEDIL